MRIPRVMVSLPESINLKGYNSASLRLCVRAQGI